jgi:hypothetical protein
MSEARGQGETRNDVANDAPHKAINTETRSKPKRALVAKPAKWAVQ